MVALTVVLRVVRGIVCRALRRILYHDGRLDAETVFVVAILSAIAAVGSLYLWLFSRG